MIAVTVHDNVLQVPDSVHKTFAAFDAGGVPWCGLLKITDKHLIKTHGVSTVLFDNIIRVDNIASGFAHFFAVFTQNHAMAGSLLIRLGSGYNADVV
ncbi:hypothetical protein SDC9_202543 [bioreactor metagenome]|uniref:Uncharacterized protein n=1 Tax=bioreactor metagenome TaxID=1076179 RepID=A0A645ITW5_9ZZZZ